MGGGAAGPAKKIQNLVDFYRKTVFTVAKSVNV